MKYNVELDRTAFYRICLPEEALAGGKFRFSVFLFKALYPGKPMLHRM